MGQRQRRSCSRCGQGAFRKVHACLWNELESVVRVWVVDGRLVRSVFDVDFTEGGHDRVYEYVSPREIWIDNDLNALARMSCFMNCTSGIS